MACKVDDFLKFAQIILFDRITHMTTYILFVLGFVLLIKGADVLVEGASSVAKKFNLSNMLIGLTIVAFGTSMPELVVNIFASVKGNTEIAIGNILGSNIANILLILGISALIFPLKVKRQTVWKEIPFSLLAVLALFFLANDMLIDNASQSVLARSEELVLISFFIIFLYYTFGIAFKEDGDDESTSEEYKIHSVQKSTVLILLGLTGLFFGGQWIVNGAIEIASNLGLSESLIGLTVVAIGTSLPELATSAVAAMKKQTDIAIGNAVGSNIFNILWILGLSSVIKTLDFNSNSNIDILVCVVATFLLFAFCFIGKRHMIQKWQGAMFIFLYLSYVTFLVINEMA